MPRRIISDPNHAFGVEMRLVDPDQVPLLPGSDDSGFLFQIDEPLVDRPAGTYEPVPQVREADFRDLARDWWDQTLAQKAELKKNAINNIVGEIPEILHHLSIHVPVVGQVIAGIALTQETQEWNHTRNLLEKMCKYYSRIENDSFLKPTLRYIVEQLETKKTKQEILILGKVVQLAGGVCTTCAIFTAGATLLPGIMIGVCGSVIRFSVTIRSAIVHKMKSNQGTLSLARKEHAAYLFALSIEHLKRGRGVDLAEYNENPEYAQYKASLEMIEEINSKLSVEEQEFSAGLAALLVRTMGIKYYPGHRERLDSLPEFLRLGFHELFNALKS